MHDPTKSLPPTGFLRLHQIIGSRTKNPPVTGLIPIGRSTWLEGVKSGRYPQPVKGLGDRISVWRVEDILAFIEGLICQQGAQND
ncbi:MAG: transcriptional regulator [Betaproteobacteria bacterium]|nr:transcriptional regulator [Betaproteobacteria bacterium]